MEKTIRIDGIIGDWGNTPEEFQYRIEDLDLQSDDELIIIINSAGGSVIDGFGIYNQIKAIDNKTTTKIEGFAASIAALIAMSADEVQMSEVGQFMIHRASVVLQGDKNELEKQAEILISIDETQTTVFMNKTGLDKETISAMLDKETWFSAKEAKKQGFVDSIVDKVTAKMAAIYSINLKHNKMDFKKLLQKLSGNIETEVKAETENVEMEVKAETENVEVEVKAETEQGLKAEIEVLKEILAELMKGLDQAKAEAEKKPEVSEVENLISDKIEALVKNLPKSTGQPTASQTKFSTSNVKTDRFQSFRERQKEIESKTRLE